MTDIHEDLEDRMEDKKITDLAELESDYNFIGNKALIDTLVSTLLTMPLRDNYDGGTISVTGVSKDEAYH